ncbi:MAG: hypothetical protein JO307_33145 [Bryobacterales bacterium]|nr:hypothetical protein [Bryobacterales bacterium]MBV9396663.1 hypothetical protein [Bryobacterales bacterium]
MKQPITGFIATLIIIAISFGFISLFDFPTFSGWVTYALICLIPMEIVIGVTWACKFPVFAANQRQPLKGILLALILPVVGAIFGAVYYYTAGGGVSPPTPMLAMCTIVSVIVTFWMAIMWGGWPFTAVIKNTVLAGFVLVAACYAVNYLLFRIFFNYEFMRGAPVYVPSLDPHGMFNAWYALVFYMSAIGVMFLMLHFDLWPLTTSPALMKQPVLGLVWTLIALAVGGLAFYIAVYVIGMDVVAYMIKAPVAFIFGTIVVLNMLQASLFAKMTQPVKGVLSAATAAVIGVILSLVYGALAPTLTGQLAVGPPGYDFERWLASALLGVTFPLLVLYAEFFKFWPLQRAE